MNATVILPRLLTSILIASVLSFLLVRSNPLRAADLYGPRVMLTTPDRPPISLAGNAEGATNSPEGVVRLDAFPGLDEVLWDNGATDGSEGYSNAVEAVFGARRTVLDDFVVPAGGWEIKRFDWLHQWFNTFSGVGTGVEIEIYFNDPNGGGASIDGPGALCETAVVRSFGEAFTGRAWFLKQEVWSWANLEAINLTPGRYWIGWTVVGPENDFAMAHSLPTDNQAWVNYADFAGLEPSENVFGVRRDLAWALSAHHQNSVAYASLGGVSNGTDDAGAVVIIDPNTGAGRYLGTPMPGRGLPGLAADSSNRLFAVTDDLNHTANAMLIEVDALNGSLMEIVGDLRLGAEPETLHDLAFHPGTEGLFGVTTGTEVLPQNTLVAVDAATAAVTSVGLIDPVDGLDTPISIAFAPNGTLWAKEADGPVLWTVDPSTGTVLTAYAIAPAAVGSIGLGVQPTNGLLLMSECCTVNLNRANDVWALDTTTMVATEQGSAGGDRRVEDITFAFFVLVDPFESRDLSAWTLAVP